MVAGHLTLKNGKYYAVLNYKNAGGQRKTKWISLGLPEKGNKRKAEAELARLRAEFEPPKEVGDLNSDMLLLIICWNGWRSPREGWPTQPTVPIKDC